MASGLGDEEGNAEGASWRLIGPASELSKKRCRLMYSSLGYDSDVCLYYVKGEFFAMDARCAHSGKNPNSSSPRLTFYIHLQGEEITIVKPKCAQMPIDFNSSA